MQPTTVGPLLRPFPLPEVANLVQFRSVPDSKRDNVSPEVHKVN